VNRSQLSWLTSEQLSGLTSEQLSWLTRSQLSGLTSEQKIPTIPNLYSLMLAAIKDEQRVLDQSTFGPESDPGTNLCDSPMCIAGHTVNLAGAEGYKLKNVFGFAGAARLIHNASRPDVGAPRYDVYPSEWALAYISERAAEEKAKAA
jgi:hypothetical protein